MKPKQTAAQTNVGSLVLEFLRDNGPSTGEEIAQGIKKSPLRVRPEISDLHESGDVVDTGMRRKKLKVQRGDVFGPDGIAGHFVITREPARAATIEFTSVVAPMFVSDLVDQLRQHPHQKGHVIWGLSEDEDRDY